MNPWKYYNIPKRKNHEIHVRYAMGFCIGVTLYDVA